MNMLFAYLYQQLSRSPKLISGKRTQFIKARSYCQQQSKIMDANDLIPDVLDAPTRDQLHVIYPPNHVVHPGLELTPTQVKAHPIVSWPYNEDARYYALLMVDPDAPCRAAPKYREILHWALVNMLREDMQKAQTVAEYMGAGPPEGGGLHRYCFLLYEQPDFIDEQLYIGETTRQGRLNFSARAFASKHNLGAPTASNYFQAQYDDYVPIRNSKFTG